MIQAKIHGNFSEDAQYGSAMVNITNHCNLECRHCFIYRDGNINEAPVSIKDEMHEDVILQTLEQLRNRHGIKHMLWMGGEPMLKPRLLAKGIKLFETNTITTNGTAPLIDFGPDLLYVISLDGPQDINDAIRGEGVFRKVLRNLERLPEGFSSPYQTQCVVTKTNQHRLEELVQQLQDSPVQWLTFSFLVPSSGDLDNPDVWRDNKEREEAVNIVLDLRRRYAGFVRNSVRSLELMFSPYAERVVAVCPSTRNVLPLYLEGDHFATPFCCYGDDVDCERCGAWVVFNIAAKMEGNGVINWEEEIDVNATH